jgi:hypothetical protein
MKKIACVFAVLLASATGAVMADGDAQPSSTTASGAAAAPASGSKFSKLLVGMHGKEVMDLIGAPSDQKSYQTGKAFIPFHFGGDNFRIEQHYKGEGILTFSGGGIGDSSMKLIRIAADPSESGYVR